MRKNLLLFTALLLLLISCSSEIRTIRVYTDIPEAILLMNRFNNLQSRYTAEVTTLKQTGSTIPPEQGDLLLAENIQTGVYLAEMVNLNKFRETPYVRKVYPELLQSCIYETELKMIPLSMDLPLIISKKGNSPTESRSISWQELSESALAFNREEDGELKAAGFSPLWSDDFLINSLSSGLNAFSRLMDDSDSSYTERSSRLAEWMEKHSNGVESINQFDSTYRYIPDYRLLINGRIGFSLIRLSDYMLLPENISKELSFRYLKFEKDLQPLNILSAGVFSDSPNPEGAEALLQWLLEEETWSDYYNEILQNRDRTFAFEGISGSYGINETLLTEAYPSLTGRIPYPGELDSIPEFLPQWNRVREEVLLPHIRKVLGGTADATSLGDEYRKWLLLNPDPLSD